MIKVTKLSNGNKLVLGADLVEFIEKHPGHADQPDDGPQDHGARGDGRGDPSGGGLPFAGTYLSRAGRRDRFGVRGLRFRILGAGPVNGPRMISQGAA